MNLVVFEEDVLRLTCGRCLEEKQSFYDELKCEWDMHSADDIVICLGDIDGHVGRHIDGFDEGYCEGQRNGEGRMLLDLSGEGIMCVKYMV